MEIIWHGHSCFELLSSGFSLVIDPYDHHELCGYGELQLTADAVICSHSHYGHSWLGAVTLRHGTKDPFEVEAVDTYHDVMRGRLRGGNRLHIIRAEGLKLVHLGDLGCRLTDEQLARISGADAIMAPAGGILTIEPYAAYELCRACGLETLELDANDVNGIESALRTESAGARALVLRGECALQRRGGAARKYETDANRCRRCGACGKLGCPAISGRSPVIDPAKCAGCGMCAAVCKCGAIRERA